MMCQIESPFFNGTGQLKQLDETYHVFHNYARQFSKDWLASKESILGCANKDMVFFSKVIETLEVQYLNFNVSRTLLKKPQISICKA